MSYYSWFHFLFAFTICINGVFSESESEEDSYTKHCSSVIPPFNVTTRSNGSSLPSLSTPYFTGGDRFRPANRYPAEYDVQKVLTLRLRPDHYQTATAGVYSVEGFLYISFVYGFEDDLKLRFPMNGFWSEKSRKLCMLGSTSWNGTDLGAVLKLKFEEENPTIHTAVVSGSLESTASSANAPAYFDPFLIFHFPAAVSDYSYSLVPKESGAGGAPRSWKDESLSLDSADFCSVLEERLGLLLLEYPPECAERRRTHLCSSPVGSGDESLPNYVALTSIQCDKREKRARFLAKFMSPSNYGNFNFPIDSTAIGEAWWDDNSNRITGAACGISNPSLDFGNPVGDDCTMRLSLRLPTVITMRNDAKIVGEISKDSGYFTPIGVASYYGDLSAAADCTGQRYEYREVDRVRESCREKKARKKKKGKVYPDGNSDDMRFDLTIRNGGGEKLGSAYMEAVPAKNGCGPTLDLPNSDRKSNAGELKMRYKITIYPNYPSSSSNQSEATLDWAVMGFYVLMNAEGVYDSETGQLCMVACRKVTVNSGSNFVDDCDVAVELEVPPRNERRYVKGIIGSTRPPTDALYFHDLIIESQF